MDAAFSIYTRNFATLVKIAACIWIPLALLLCAIDIWAYTPIDRADAHFGDLIRLDGKIVDHTRVIVDGLFTLILNLVGSLLVVGASLHAVNEVYLGRKPQVGPSLRSGNKRGGSIFWIVFLMMLAIGGLAVAGVATIVGIFVFFPLALFLIIRWWLAIPALLVEDHRGLKALGRSKDLVADNWWRVFGVVFVIGVFVAIFGSIVPNLIFEGMKGLAEDNFNLWLVLANALAVVGSIVTAPLLAAATIVLYYEMRVRKEGFDVELMAERLGAPEPGARDSVAGRSQPPPSSPPPATPA